MDSNALKILDISSQSKPQKSNGSSSSGQSNIDKNAGNKENFSGYLDKSTEKPPVRASERAHEKASEKSALKENTRGTDNQKSQAKVEKTESDTAVEKKTGEIDEDVNAEVAAVGTDADDDIEEQAVKAGDIKVEVEDDVELSTAALVNLLLQRAIKSNVGEGTDKPKGLDNAVLATQQHSSALATLLQQRADVKDLINKDLLLSEEFKQSIEKLTPGLAKLLLSEGKGEGKENKLLNLNNRQELLAQNELKPVDEVLDIKKETGDLMTKFLEKMDLKNKGEVSFQNRMMSDKAAIVADTPDLNLNRMSVESMDKNILLNSMNNSERLNSSSAIQQAKMNVPMTNPDWGLEFGKRIQMLMKNNIQHAEIRMDPPGLGSIQVRINMNQDQANITFTALHANVREAIETNMNRLRDMLGDSGLQLGETDVNSQFQQQTNQRSDEQGQFSLQKQAGNSAEESDVAEMPGAVVQHSIDGVIDYFA